MSILATADIERINEESLRVLWETGVQVDDDVVVALLREHGWELVLELSRIAPGRVPRMAFRPVEREQPTSRSRGILAELVFCGLGWAVPKLGLALSVGSWVWRLLCWLAQPQQPYFEGIATFRDLCYRLVDLPAPVRPRLA